LQRITRINTNSFYATEEEVATDCTVNTDVIPNFDDHDLSV